MNEIFIFKGKREDTGAWVKGYLVVTDDGYYIIKDAYLSTIELDCYNRRTVIDGNFYEVDPKTVGQLRYKKDGMELYDGDIVYMKYKALTQVFEIKGVVMYSLSKGQTVVCEQDSFLSRCVPLHVRKIEIKKLGNKFDNPELLAGEK